MQAHAPPCLLVRTHNPTRAQMDRIGEWHRALEPTEFELYVSVDVTAAAGLATASALCSRVPPARIHTYTEAEMAATYHASMRHFTDVERFPGGEGAQKVYADRRTVGCSLAWGMHVEPICLWAHAVGWHFSCVWVCEDDIGFSGEVAAFLRAYAHDPADVVTNMASPSSAFRPPHVRCGVVVRPGSGWFWHDTCTPAYARQVPPGARFKTSEHLNRLSARLLRELDRLSRAEGVSAWSEQFFVSVALQRERGFSVALFRPEHVGSPYQWNGRVSARDWFHICREDRAAAAVGSFHRSYLLPSISPIGYAMPMLAPPVQGAAAHAVAAAAAAAAAAVPHKRRRAECVWPFEPRAPQPHGFEGKIYHVRARAGRSLATRASRSPADTPACARAPIRRSNSSGRGSGPSDLSASESGDPPLDSVSVASVTPRHRSDLSTHSRGGAIVRRRHRLGRGHHAPGHEPGLLPGDGEPRRGH